MEQTGYRWPLIARAFGAPSPSRVHVVKARIFSTSAALYNRGMDLIEEIRAKFSQDEFEFSKHATDQTILREISVQEIREAVATGEIIEDNPMISTARVA